MFSRFLVPGNSNPARSMSRSTPNMDLGALLASQPPSAPRVIQISNRAGSSGMPNPLFINRGEAEPIEPPIRLRLTRPDAPERAIKSYSQPLSTKNGKFQKHIVCKLGVGPYQREAMRIAEHAWNKIPFEYQRGSTISIGVAFGYNPKLHTQAEQWKMQENANVEISGRDNLHSYNLNGIYWDCSMTGIADKVGKNRKNYYDHLRIYKP